MLKSSIKFSYAICVGHTAHENSCVGHKCHEHYCVGHKSYENYCVGHKSHENCSVCHKSQTNYCLGHKSHENLCVGHNFRSLSKLFCGARLTKLYSVGQVSIVNSKFKHFWWISPDQNLFWSFSRARSKESSSEFEPDHNPAQMEWSIGRIKRELKHIDTQTFKYWGTGNSIFKKVIAFRFRYAWDSSACERFINCYCHCHYMQKGKWKIIFFEHRPFCFALSVRHCLWYFCKRCKQYHQMSVPSYESGLIARAPKRHVLRIPTRQEANFSSTKTQNSCPSSEESSVNTSTDIKLLVSIH